MNGNATTVAALPRPKQKRTAALARITPILTWIGYGVLAYFLADRAFLLDVYPFGVALLAAAPGAAAGGSIQTPPS